MRVDLKAMLPNPFRDFKVDPVDQNVVNQLVDSIREDSYWGGIVARRVRGGVQLIAGEHRRQAAIIAGITHADVHIGDFDDGVAVRIYARENATQRGNHGTALAGSVAAAIRDILHHDLMNESSNSDDSPRGGKVRREGVGEDRILEKLKGIPGIGQRQIRQQIAMLKASGDYSRIIQEVIQQVEEERRTDFDALEEAEVAREKADARAHAAELMHQRAKTKEDKQKAAAERKAAVEARKTARANEKKYANTAATRNAIIAVRGTMPKGDPTFDYAGVAKHLPYATHIETFKKLVTAKGIEPYLPVAQQHKLAEELARHAKENNLEISSTYIREKIMELLIGARFQERQLAKEEQEKLMREDWNHKSRLYQESFARSCRGMLSAASDLLHHQKTCPNGMELQLSGEFRHGFEHVETALKMLRNAGMGPLQ